MPCEPNVSPRSLTCAIFCGVLAAALTGCGGRKATAPVVTVPPASYTISDQDVRVHFIGGEVRIQASYQLQNTGETPLDELRISLRQVNSSAAYDLTLSIDGANVAWERFETANDRGLRAKMPGSWQPRQARIAILSYAFRSASQMPGNPGYVSETFQLFPAAWSPILLAPQQAGTAAVAAPRKWNLSVKLPAAMLVHASGLAAGGVSREDETEHNFEQAGDNLTFVLAGHYDETLVSSGGFNLRFWNRRYRPRAGDPPIKPPAFDYSPIGVRLAATMKSISSLLGPRDANANSLWIMDGSGVRLILNAPGVALFGIAPDVILDTGMSMDRTGHATCVAEERLASLWLGWIARPELSAAALAERLATHVAQSVPGGCGYSKMGVERREDAIRYVLEQHAQRQKIAAAAERAAVREGMKYEIQALAMRLFVFALEDAVGREKLNAAIARLLRTSRGSSWSAETFRAALEAESRKKLAPLFKKWLEQPAIPADFSAKYGASAPPANAQSKSE